MAIPWNDDPPAYRAVIELNIQRLIPRLQQQARSRVSPAVTLAQDWHRAIYAGVPLPVSYYAGEVRDSDPRYPELINYGVQIGPHYGAPAADVPRQLTVFEGSTQRACVNLDRAIGPGQAPVSQNDLLAVLRLAAIVHGEWVRIHPFANGNGRTARAWANWIAMRFGLPPFVTIKPRPFATLYGGAAAQSMQGNHDAMVVVFHDLLRQKLASP